MNKIAAAALAGGGSVRAWRTAREGVDAAVSLWSFWPLEPRLCIRACTCAGRMKATVSPGRSTASKSGIANELRHPCRLNFGFENIRLLREEKVSF